MKRIDEDKKKSLENENVILRKALKDIIKHQEKVSGELANRSITLLIARRALTEIEDSNL